MIEPRRSALVRLAELAQVGDPLAWPKCAGFQAMDADLTRALLAPRLDALGPGESERVGSLEKYAFGGEWGRDLRPEIFQNRIRFGITRSSELDYSQSSNP